MWFVEGTTVVPPVVVFFYVLPKIPPRVSIVQLTVNLFVLWEHILIASSRVLSSLISAAAGSSDQLLMK